MEIAALAVRAARVFVLAASAVLLTHGVSSAQYARTGSPHVVPAPTDTSRSGFLFLDGEFIPPPYDIRANADSLSINGRSIDEREFDLSDYDFDGSSESFGGPESRGPRGRWGMRMGRFGGVGERFRRTSFSGEDVSGEDVSGEDVSGRGFSLPTRIPRTTLERFADDVKGVKHGTMFVLYSGEKPRSLYPQSDGYEILKALMSESDRATTSAGPASDWQRLAEEFRPTDAFRSHAQAWLERIENAQIQGDTVLANTYWINKISYPLTVFAMGLVVLGFGHLLSNRPKLEGPENESDDWSKHRKVVGQSLLIVGLLSCVDLIWTLGTGSAGMMRELNPLGKEMLNTPLQLSLFKLLATGMAIAILYRLHRRPFAQAASWWCCLVLTLLTARWIVFQSMFL